MKRVNIKTVAKEAGVSTQTVSRVINNELHVAPATKERVMEAIDRLGYRPSQLARNLLRGRSHTLGVMGYGMGLYGPSRTLLGIEHQAVEAGYNLFLRLLRNPEYQNPEEFVNEMLANYVEGIIWAVPQIGDNRNWIFNLVPKLPVPVVFIRSEPHTQLSVVAFNNELGGKLAASHLIENGYQTIGIITGPLGWWEARMRLQGWKTVMRANDCEVNENLIVEGGWYASDGARAMKQLLAQRPDMDAVFVSNDRMALGAIKSAVEAGRRIPHDLGIVGFDNTPESEYYQPALTTIAHDLNILGRRAVEELDRMIQQIQNGSELCVQDIFLDVQLIVRESSTRRR